MADDRARKEAEEREERAKITLALTDQKTMERLSSSGELAKMARPNAPSHTEIRSDARPAGGEKKRRARTGWKESGIKFRIWLSVSLSKT